MGNSGIIYLNQTRLIAPYQSGGVIYLSESVRMISVRDFRNINETCNNFNMLSNKYHDDMMKSDHTLVHFYQPDWSHLPVRKCRYDFGQGFQEYKRNM